MNKNNSKRIKSLGGLWKNDRRTHSKAPYLLGSIKLTEEEIRLLMEVAVVDGQAKVNLAAWKNRNRRTSEDYYTLEAQAPYVHPSGPSPSATLDSHFGDDHEGDLI